MISSYYFQHHNFGRCAFIYTETEITLLHFYVLKK